MTPSELPDLVELLRYRALDQPDLVGFVFLGNEGGEPDALTYRKLDAKARAIGARLQSMAPPGSRALLFFPPGLEFVSAFFGCLYAGLIAVPLHVFRSNHNLSKFEAIAVDSQATVVLMPASLLAGFKGRLLPGSALAALQCLATDDIAVGVDGSWQKPSVCGDTLAMLQYTSGSTGTPKGVMISHGNLLHNSAQIQASFEHTSESQGVIWLPPYHDMGLTGGILQPLYSGFPVALMSPLDFLQKPFRWLQAITRYGGTTSGGPNFAYDLCVKKITPEQRSTLDLRTWDVAFTGAEPVRAESLERFASTFEPCGFRSAAFYPCYGLAEATLFVSGGVKARQPNVRRVAAAALEYHQAAAAPAEGKSGRLLVGCGYPRLGQKILIVNPETLTRCQEGEVGEIWVLGSSVTRGYWNSNEETELAFNAYLSDGSEGPALRSGDLGFLQDGELFCTGRCKDLIIIRGRNHYPQDIELTVERSHPALLPGGGAAFSVEAEGNERLVVVHEVGRKFLRTLNVDEAIRSIRRAVAQHHGLDVYAPVLIKPANIPRTSNGKVRRYLCRAMFLEGTLDVVGIAHNA
jgi:acyl-CoA synthetase (AMP-forming)/AMP-acid ligase II